MKIPRIYLEVTTMCNYRCVYCPHPTMQRPKEHITWELAVEALQQIREDAIGDNVWLNYLGEPLLYPRLFELADHAKALGLSTHVITNGSLLTAPMVDKLRHSALSTIKVSHDSTFGDAAAAHGAPRFPPAMVLSNIGLLLEAIRGTGKRVVVILMTTLPGFEGAIDGLQLISSPEELRREVQAVLDVAAQHIPLPSQEYLDQALAAIKWKAWNSELRISEELAIEIRPTFNWGNTMTAREVIPTKTGYCNALIEKVAILVDGDVVPCCVDSEGELAIGNIREQRLGQILQAEKARLIRESFAANQVVLEKCQRCLGTPLPAPEKVSLPVLSPAP